MRRLARLALCVALFLSVCSSADFIWAVDPTPLESAYWRFEEGTVGERVSPRNEPVVVDEFGGDNNMQAFLNQDETIDSAPTYTSDVAPTPLRSGAPNNLALDFLPSPTGQDLHTSGKPINNPIIENGFTLEAAFKPLSIDRFQVVVGKDGKPSPTMPEQTLALKMRGDTNELQVELFDKSNTIHGVRSSAPLEANQWYYAAVVNDGTNLSLYLDRNDGNGYVLQGTDPNPLSGALWEGENPGVPDGGFNSSWTIGRGMYNEGATDWFDGIIDEVRLTNTVLSPSQFLFAPAGAGPDGDHNGDGVVDAADYVLWKKTNINGDIGYDDWVRTFGESVFGAGQSGQVPEPHACALVFLAAFGSLLNRRRK